MTIIRSVTDREVNAKAENML